MARGASILDRAACKQWRSRRSSREHTAHRGEPFSPRTDFIRIQAQLEEKSPLSLLSATVSSSLLVTFTFVPLYSFIRASPELYHPGRHLASVVFS